MYILGVDRNIKANKNHSKFFFFFNGAFSSGGSGRLQCSEALAVTTM